MAICYIIGAGDVSETDIIAKKEDFIICADAGYRYGDMLGREPDLVVGDFDSLGRIPETEKRIVLPCEKDDSDMAVCVEEGLKRGYREFVLFGALGGERIDHSIGNIQLLKYIASKGARGTIYHGNNVLTAFSDGELTFPEESKGYISVFSLSEESNGVTIKNLKYTTDNVSLYSHRVRGLSNEFIGRRASVSVREGILLTVYTK